MTTMGQDNEPLRLLIEWDDERTVVRRREAAFLSVIVHLVAIVLLLMEPHIFRSVRRSLGIAEPQRPHQQLTYLALPPTEEPTIKPKTGVLSDQDRIKRPGIEEPSPRLTAPPPPVAEKAAREPESEKKQQALNLPPPPPLPAEKAPPPPLLQLGEATNPQPKLALPQAGTPGRSLDETLRAMAQNRAAGGGQAVGDVGVPQGGFSPRTPGAIGGAQILTDTMGVDFDPYLRRVIADIRQNWFAVMPEIARLGKRGRVVVIFDIQRDGTVAKLFLVSASGAEPLDRASLAGISASVPFPALPAEFRGPVLRLQVSFLYNVAPE
ncbi:MAG: TonB family protein [Acidobacteria bacterium]|nr:TonB family protein [Acidobacteriota bacterium]